MASGRTHADSFRTIVCLGLMWRRNEVAHRDCQDKLQRGGYYAVVFAEPAGSGWGTIDGR